MESTSRERRRQRRAAERAGLITASGGTATSSSATATPMFELAPSSPGFEVIPQDGYWIVRPAEDSADISLDAIEDVLAPAPELAEGDPTVVVVDERPAANPSPEAPVIPVASGSLVRWTAVFVPEGEPTDDGRIMAPGAIRWRNLPLTLMAMTETPGEGGHAGAQIAGKIESIRRADNLILADGYFDTGEFGQEIARMVGDQTLRGLSVDLAIPDFATLPRSQVLDDEGNYIGPLPNEERTADPDEAPSLVDILFGDSDEELMFVVLDGVIGMATVCPFPAFANAEISLASSAVIAGGDVRIPDQAKWRGQASFQLRFVSVDELPAPAVITASAASLVPVEPPSEWFAAPEPDGPCPLTITDDGQVFGHAAVWGTCHIGIEGVCVEPPVSESDYSRFLLKEVVCEDGSSVAVGTVTLDTGHADRRLDRMAATSHYDDTGTAVADVVVKDGEHGIWVAGALRPDADAIAVRKLRGAVLSGDWRDDDGHLEMVALLAVNVPGFPVPRAAGAALVASAEGLRVVALTAAGLNDGREHRVAIERIRALGIADELSRLAEEVDG